MQRRDFLIKSALLATTPLILGSCTSTSSKTKKSTDPKLEKVKTALLTMQRASWEQGVAAQAFLELGDIDTTLLMAKEAALRQLDDGRLSVLYSDNGVTDPAASGEAVLFAAKHLNDADLSDTANRMLNYLLTKAPKSDKGIIYHTLNAPEIWIDSMYMAPPFLTVAGEFDEALKQIEGIKAALWNEEHKLYSHRWENEKKIFINEKFWGVGNGWALAGIARVIKVLPESHSAQKATLIVHLIEHLDSCLKYLRTDGLFHNIIDDAESFIETNLAQMIAYTIFTGLLDGWLSKDYLIFADNMRNAAHNKVDDYGFVQGVCGAPWFDSAGRAAEGQAFFLLMEAARNKYLAIEKNL